MPGAVTKMRRTASIACYAGCERNRDTVRVAP
jgi:hypothetical protein